MALLCMSMHKQNLIGLVAHHIDLTGKILHQIFSHISEDGSRVIKVQGSFSSPIISSRLYCLDLVVVVDLSIPAQFKLFEGC